MRESERGMDRLGFIAFLHLSMQKTKKSFFGQQPHLGRCPLEQLFIDRCKELGKACDMEYAAVCYKLLQHTPIPFFLECTPIAPKAIKNDF